MKRQVPTNEFFALHPVFSLTTAERELAPKGGRPATLERLKHHLETGRLLLLAREIYAVVPIGLERKRFSCDPCLCALSTRPDAVFSHHTALQLLGAAHSVSNRCTIYTAQPRRALRLPGMTIHYLAPPAAMRTRSARPFASQSVAHLGQLLQVTGPERTLVEGLRKPSLCGGLEELLASAAGFPTLDLDLLQQVLCRYESAQLWAATGWFLERTRKSFHVDRGTLSRFERRRPATPRYLLRAQRGGMLARRWNMIVPPQLETLGEHDDS